MCKILSSCQCCGIRFPCKKRAKKSFRYGLLTKPVRRFDLFLSSNGGINRKSMQIRLLLVCLLIGGVTQAQSVKGKLLDLVDNKPLQAATVTLKPLKDSTNPFSTIADNAGQFRFSALPRDTFYLEVSYVGYENFRQFVVLSDSIPDVDLGTLFVPKVSQDLGAVVVTSKTPPTQQKGDTTQYNASQFKVNPDATTEDLIKKMPGITGHFFYSLIARE